MTLINQSPAPGTALITGASSGIGDSYARQLAARGYHLLLTARREERLRALATELVQKHTIKTEVLAADLTQDADLSRLEQRIQACSDFSLLVNNAGFGTGGLFYKTDIAKQLAMINVHVTAPVRLARAALPQMMNRRSGALINVASVAAFAAVPTGSMYGSTKAWMVSWSRALSEELRPHNIKVQALCPGFTHTGFHETPEYKNFDRAVIPSFLWMSSDYVVTTSLKALERDQVICIPGLIYKLMVMGLRFPPAAALARHFARKRWRRESPE